MRYAFERWLDLRAYAVDREVIAVWYEQPPLPLTWISFQVDAIRAVGHWAGRESIPPTIDREAAFFVMDAEASANIAANLRANGLHLCRTFHNRAMARPDQLGPPVIIVRL